MKITPQESHHISVLAGQGDVANLRSTVAALASRENVSAADVLLASRDDFQNTAAHMAAKAGQARSIEALAGLFLDTTEKKTEFFNMANRFTGDRPIHTAMREGYLEVFKALVRHGADPLIKNRFGDSVKDYLGDFEGGEVQRIIDSYKEKGQGGISDES